MATGITTPQIEAIYEAAIKAGASGGKISGAGGGGYLVFYCPGNTRFSVIETLKQFGGHLHRYEYVNTGLTTWTIK